MGDLLLQYSPVTALRESIDMPILANFPPIREIYNIEETIDAEVTMRGVSHRVRIEALHDMKNNGGYSARAYIEREFLLTPQTTVPPTPASMERLWVSFDLPYITGRTADAVLNTALAFLEERSN
jgi:hypothetical protein